MRRVVPQGIQCCPSKGKLDTYCGAHSLLIGALTYVRTYLRMFFSFAAPSGISLPHPYRPQTSPLCQRTLHSLLTRTAGSLGSISGGAWWLPWPEATRN